jgi:hypothetical protein
MVLLLVRQLLQLPANFTAANAVANVDALYAAIPVEYWMLKIVAVIWVVIL